MSECELEKLETLADIVSEMRECAESADPAIWGDPRIAGLVRNAKAKQIEYANRIEEAAKRDEERAIEHATRHAETVARDNCRDCLHNPNGKNYEPIGNAAATYAALVKIHDLTNALDEECGVDPVEIRDIARTALSAPARQCDVGTAEEQSDRFASLCDSYSGCSQCPVKSRWNFANGHKPSCGVLWAQTPYEAQEGGAE